MLISCEENNGAGKGRVRGMMRVGEGKDCEGELKDGVRKGRWMEIFWT